jgi:SRSO17 transposase
LLLILKIVNEQKIFLIIDETGDPKKGKATDYVASKYLGRLGKIDNGIVAVVSYGLISQGFSGFTHTAYSPLEREQSRSLRNPKSFNVK